jgi:disulfide oxidoreductase YuzD
MTDNKTCNNAKQRWLESLSTSDLLYLMLILDGQIVVDENDETQKKLKRSYKRVVG